MAPHNELLTLLLGLFAGALLASPAAVLFGWRFCRLRVLPVSGSWPVGGDAESNADHPRLHRSVVRFTLDPGRWPWSDGDVRLVDTATAARAGLSGPAGRS